MVLHPLPLVVSFLDFIDENNRYFVFVFVFLFFLFYFIFFFLIVILLTTQPSDFLSIVIGLWIFEN